MHIHILYIKDIIYTHVIYIKGSYGTRADNAPYENHRLTKPQSEAQEFSFRIVCLSSPSDTPNI